MSTVAPQRGSRAHTSRVTPSNYTSLARLSKSTCRTSVAADYNMISAPRCKFSSPLPSDTACRRADSCPSRIDPAIRLRRAIHAGDALLVERILKSHPHLLHNPDISAAGLSNSSLHLAASLGHRATCEALLAAGHEDPTPALNENHQTALMLAAAAGHSEVVHLLCERDARCVLRRDARGRDAVMDACAGGHDTVLQLLLTYSPGGPADAVQRADAEGNTALHFACGSGSLLCLRTLLAAGADVERRNVWNWTPAAYSATVQAEAYLKSLVSEARRRQKADVEKQQQQQTSPRKMGLGMVRVVPDDSDDDE